MIPTYMAAMPAVLRALANGVARHRHALSDGVVNRFQLDADARERQYPTHRGALLCGRPSWALTYRTQTGLMRSPKRGWYEMTDRGLEALPLPAATIDRRVLDRYPEFREFMDRSRSRSAFDDTVETAAVAPATGLAPDEAIKQVYRTLRAEVEQELLDTVKAASPEFFERLVVDLLVRMGYGSNRETAARAVGRSGDSGIDGVIDEDRRGLDVIYLQAKRWEGGVGRPEIQKFVGALQGQRARKGIFLTTSHFTKDDEDYVTRIDSRINLVDGRSLAALMFDYEVGVAPRSNYTVKGIDGDYFDEN